MFQELFELSFWLRILFSIICGMLIGLERQIRGKPIGIRTSILICLGTMLFMYLEIKIEEKIGMGMTGHTELARVLGQIVTGVGFLGAGVIMTREGLVSGVTSASIVWLLAGIGAAIGLEHYGVALVICIIAVSVLTGAHRLEDVFKGLQRGVHRRKHDET